MAADSDGTLKAVVICEGDLHDPEFPKKFRTLLGKLNSILDPPKRKKRLIKVNKVEPWNSVRVTLSIPKDAASKLRQLAAEGSTALRALGILSVQLEGDTVISLRLVGQEIVLRAESENGQTTTGNQDSNSFGDFVNMLSRVPTPQNNQQQQSPVATVAAVAAIPPAAAMAVSPFISDGSGGPPPSCGLMTAASAVAAIKPSASSNSLMEHATSNLTNGPNVDGSKPLFKSPNTVCPMGGKLPPPVPANLADATREYPFESMTQARVIHRRENTLGAVVAPPTGAVAVSGGGANPFGSPPPPPYPSVSPTQTVLSSVAVSGGGGGKPGQLNSIGNKLPLHVATGVTPPPPSGNIAISSPLLVNLLQNESTSSANMNAAKMTPPPMASNVVGVTSATTASHALQRQQSTGRLPIQSQKSVGIDVKQPPQILSPLVQQQMRAPHQQQLFVAGGEATTMPPQQQQQHAGNIGIQRPPQQLLVSPQQHPHQQQQQNALITVGSAPMSVPSPLSPQHQQQKASKTIAMQQKALHPDAFVLPGAWSSIKAQANAVEVLSPHPLMQQQQQQLLSPQHPLPPQQQQPGQAKHYLGMAPDAGMQLHRIGAQDPTTSLQMQMAQQQQQQQQLQMQMMQQQQQQQIQQQQLQQQQMPLQQQQQSQQNVDQTDLAYNPRWPLKPMDSATKSSFQEFTRYQMQYNLSQQQQSTPVDPTADQLADLDEIATLESLLPTLNDSDLDLDIKAPLEELVLDLIDPSMSGDPNANAMPTQQAPPANVRRMMPMNQQPLQHLQQQQQQLEGGAYEHAKAMEQRHPLQQPYPNLNRGADPTPGMDTWNGVAGMVAANQPHPPQNDLVPRGQIMHPAYAPRPSPVFPDPPTAPTTKLIGGNKSSGGRGGRGSAGGSGASSGGKEKQFLINPLTGELEPIPSDESGDETRVTSAPFTEINSEISNSMYSDDDNSCSTGVSKTTPDHSDNERSSNSETSSLKGKGKQPRKERKDAAKKVKAPREKTTLKNSLLKEKLQQGLKEKLLGKNSASGAGGVGGVGSSVGAGSGKLSAKEKKSKAIASPIISNASIADSGDKSCPEKIKLRLKLEKSEPVTAAYKVDVSFGQSPKRAQSSPTTAKIVSTDQNDQYDPSRTASTPPTNSEELRVPPLHISLRGRNSVVIQNSKKDRKKSQSGGGADRKASDVPSTTPTTDGIDATSPSPLSRLHHTNSNANAEMQSPAAIAATNQVDDRTKASAITISAPQKIKHKTSDDVKEKTIARIIAKIEPKQENGESPSLTKQQQQLHMDAVKRSSTESPFASNGSVCPEKKRRLSQSLLNASASSIDTPPPPPPSSATATASSITITSTPAEHPTIQVTTPPPSAMNKATIGSTNVGTLPQHSSLSSSTSSSSSGAHEHSKLPPRYSQPPPRYINNNNSATLNKVKSVSKLKSKTLITMLKQHSGRAVGPNKNITVVVTPKPSATTAAAPATATQTLAPAKGAGDARMDLTVRPPESFQLAEPVAEAAPTAVQSAPAAMSIAQATATTCETPSRTGSVHLELRDSTTNCETPSRSTTTTVFNCTTTTTTATVATPALADRTESRGATTDPSATQLPTTTSCQNTQSASQIVRSSPGAQAQGEDSGIESMDALSEKSPHQSASPQAIDTKIPCVAASVSPVVSRHVDTESAASGVEEKSNSLSIVDEVKLDDLTENGTAVVLPSGFERSEASERRFRAPANVPKVNGDHSANEINADDEDKINRLMDELVSSTSGKASKIVLTDEPMIILNKVDALLDDGKLKGCIEMESKLNANGAAVRTANESKSTLDNCVPADRKVKLEESASPPVTNAAPSADESYEFKPVVLVTTSTEPVLTKAEPKDEQTMPSEAIKSEEDLEIENAMSKSHVLVDGVKSESAEVTDASVLQQLSIEIPAGEGDAQRVRTRASSKLESPLEVPKQSPSDSPASGSVKSMKLSSAAVDRLSPKLAGGKGQKRKRQGSESSSQSSVSDDTPIRGKKTRRVVSDVSPSTSSASTPTSLSTQSSTQKSGAGAAKRTTENHHSKSNSSSSSPVNCKQPPSPATNASTHINNDVDQVTSKIESSSDSDEPLIEMLGKARNAKVCKIVVETDKVLRNHAMPPKVQSNTNQQNATTAMQTTQLKAGIAKADDKTCTINTRRSVRMTLNASTPKGTGKAVTPVTGAHNNHSPTLSSNVTVTAANSQDTAEMMRKSGNGQHVIKQHAIVATTINPMATDSTTPNSMDARRKTRSAGLETISEGRRRRISRDTK